jgi:hypothetical protein
MLAVYRLPGGTTMTRRTKIVLIALAMTVPVRQVVSAQVPERSPQAALEDLRADGLVSSARLFLFEGCPQVDPVGRAVFDAVRDIDLRGYGSVQLVGVFAQGTYPGCGYAPLNEWIVEMIDRWHANGEWDSLELYARSLRWPEVTIEAGVQEALLRAAEDEQGPTAAREVIADAALRWRPVERHIEEGIASFGRSIPRQTKTSWTYYLGRTFGADFFRAFAAVAPTYTDDQLFTIVSAIGTDVRHGRVPANAAGLGLLRAEISRRPNLPPWAEIGTEAVVVPHSDAPPPGR